MDLSLNHCHKFYSGQLPMVRKKIIVIELIDILKVMVAPIRPYGCVFAYSGKFHKSIIGNYQFFEMDQNKIGGVINQLN